jgi:nucleotide-binding universal stress UspA family protein
MVKHVLLPVEDSEQSAAACAFVAREFPGARVTLLHVIDPTEAGYSIQATVPSYSEEWYEREKAAAEELLDEYAAELGTDDHDIERVVEVGRPTSTIVEHAAENGVDQIVMGSHGRSGVTRILLGSVAETVVRRSPVPVTVVR